MLDTKDLDKDSVGFEWAPLEDIIRSPLVTCLRKSPITASYNKVTTFM